MNTVSSFKLNNDVNSFPLVNIENLYIQDARNKFPINMYILSSHVLYLNLRNYLLEAMVDYTLIII